MYTPFEISFLDNLVALGKTIFILKCYIKTVKHLDKSHLSKFELQYLFHLK